MADRFDGYQPAPFNQGFVGRTARSTAGAATGGIKGVVKAVGGTALAIGAFFGVAAAAAGIGLAGFGIAGTLATFAFVTLAMSAVSLVAGTVFFGGAAVSVLGLAGGLFGAAKGFTRENERAGVDQSFYNVAVAEASARGAAQGATLGQAMAYQQNPGAVAGTTGLREEPINVSTLNERKDQPGIRKQADAPADAVIQQDGAVSEKSASATPTNADKLDLAAIASKQDKSIANQI